MPTNSITLLPDRGVVRISGGDALTLLDGLLTNSLGRRAEQPAIHTGLLAPQGKILFDFYLVAAADGYLVDIERTRIDDFIKRLSFYRLRADVQFENLSESMSVAVLWPDATSLPGGIIAYPDPRNPALGQRLILAAERLGEIPAESATIDAYHEHRITVGVPEAGLDYPVTDTFPHEALYDQLHSIDFKKGCFIGQEVVSRMQHRGTARKRAIRISGDAPLDAGATIEAGEATIGVVGSARATSGIAMLRLDRASEAAAKGIPLRADGVTVTVDPPEWIAFDPASGKPAVES